MFKSPEELNTEQRRIYDSLEVIVKKHDTSTFPVQKASDFDEVKAALTDAIFNDFRFTFEQIKDSERYKNAYLSVLRFCQDQLLGDIAVSRLLWEVDQLDDTSHKTQPYFDALMAYCEEKELYKNETIWYLVRIKSLFSVHQKIGAFKLKLTNDMIISPYSIKNLAPIITGDQFAPYRKGAELVKLFNRFGSRHVYDDSGLPDIGLETGHRPSRTRYVEHQLAQLSGKPELRTLLNQVLAEAKSSADAAAAMNDVLKGDSFSVVQTSDGSYTIEGGIIDKSTPVNNEAHFNDIQNRILQALNNAEVSIIVAMAWFTNETLRDKLVEKHNEGVDVFVVAFDDGVNKKHGVDLSALPHKMIRGTRGGLMHNKFCVIDNQVVITGSYNWSTNAETKHDENVTIQKDPTQASKYSVEFRRLKA